MINGCILKNKKLLSLLLIIFLILPYGVHALEITQLSNIAVMGDYILSPTKVELSLDPGEEATRNLSLLNRSGQELYVEIEIEDFTGDQESYSKLLGDERGPSSLKDYIKLGQNNFTFSHGEAAIIPATIKIPETAEPGGLYAAVIYKVKPSQNEQENNGKILPTTRLVSLFFVRVNGDINFEGELLSFSVDKKIYKEMPINLSLIYKNDGNAHLNPYGIINIKNWRGHIIGNIEIDPYFVMPSFSREKKFIINNEIGIGLFTANLELNRGYDDIVDETEIKFWVIPNNTKYAVLSIIILIIFLFWQVKKRFNKKDRVIHNLAG